MQNQYCEWPSPLSNGDDDDGADHGDGDDDVQPCPSIADLWPRGKREIRA